ncbi:IS110 family transposase [Rhodococcus sp. ARC_M6]|uniref:IS110 family transposase n=1 Tax=Rhodococcus sp. ARC_M6 TaxID=2928852 RepID=UPI001FB47C58|nr:IS110 family transposase [Rhodococcus sp. ARC_M6]MCJ0904777.1 IS110 family transposase [Rhodococcus sp. ARC_M6]
MPGTSSKNVAGERRPELVGGSADGGLSVSDLGRHDDPPLEDLSRCALRQCLDEDDVTWAVDLTNGGAALLIALVADREQRLLYIPVRVVHHATGGYRGDSKSDAKDAAIIVDRARMRRDLHSVRVSDEISI